MSYINIIAATRRRGQRVLTMCAKLGTENGNMARLVHNLPLHSVRSGAVLSRGGFRHTYIVGLTLWPIFESAERNWRERVRQFGQSWSWIEKERVADAIEIPVEGGKAGTGHMELHLLMLASVIGAAPRGTCCFFTEEREGIVYRKSCIESDA